MGSPGRYVVYNEVEKRKDDYSYATNDHYVWTNTEPDLELIEPPILVSISRNHMKFGHKEQRPPISHKFTIMNHGEYAVAFKILTTDNFIYFVDTKYGIIPGRRVSWHPHIQMPNSVVIEVFRRPYNCIHPDQAASYFNVPKKDRLYVMLVPAHSFSIPAATYFHSEMGYEKLKICLEFTGAAPHMADVDGKLYKRVSGWYTWYNKPVGPLQKYIKEVKNFPKGKQNEVKNLGVKKGMEEKSSELAKELRRKSDSTKMKSRNHKFNDAKLIESGTLNTNTKEKARRAMNLQDQEVLLRTEKTEKKKRTADKENKSEDPPYQSGNRVSESTNDKIALLKGEKKGNSFDLLSKPSPNSSSNSGKKNLLISNHTEDVVTTGNIITRQAT